jgi:hypothetical protein
MSYGRFGRLSNPPHSLLARGKHNWIINFAVAPGLVLNLTPFLRVTTQSTRGGIYAILYKAFIVIVDIPIVNRPI